MSLYAKRLEERPLHLALAGRWCRWNLGIRKLAVYARRIGLAESAHTFRPERAG